MFGKDMKEAAAYAEKAKEYEQEARHHARKVAEYRKNLRSGSSDPQADKYMIREHQSFRRIAAANARDTRELSKAASKGWFYGIR